MTEVTAGIIKNKNGQYLICQRAENSNNGGLWEFPGGKREDGESLAKCLERELFEELSVKTKAGKMICQKEINSNGKDLLISFFECEIVSGKLTANVHNNFKWVLPRYFKKYRFCPSDSEVCVELLQKDSRIKKFYIIKLCFFYLFMFTWCLPQTIIGFVMFLALIKKKHEFYHGAIVTYHDHNWGGVSFGAFTFVHDSKNPLWRCDTRSHEFGHCIQSLIFGPLYLPLFALPSSVWCNIKTFKRYRDLNNISYGDFFTERIADKLAIRFTHENSD